MKHVLARFAVVSFALTGVGTAAAASPAATYARPTPPQFIVEPALPLPPTGDEVRTITKPRGGIRLSAIGIEPSETPFWNFHRESDGAYISTAIGNRTGSNCVSSTKVVQIVFEPDTYQYLTYGFTYAGDGIPITDVLAFQLVVI